jgi:hypothetical protein
MNNQITIPIVLFAMLLSAFISAQRKQAGGILNASKFKKLLK